MATSNNAKAIQVMTVAGINAKATGATAIFTTESVGNFYVTGITIETTASSSITVPATMSVGTNASTYNNVLVAGLLTNMTANSLFSMSIPTLAGAVVPPSTAVNANITVAATGTSQTLSVGVMGYYGP